MAQVKEGGRLEPGEVGSGNLHEKQGAEGHLRGVLFSQDTSEKGHRKRPENAEEDFEADRVCRACVAFCLGVCAECLVWSVPLEFLLFKGTSYVRGNRVELGMPV